jgi:hypothetical protein
MLFLDTHRISSNILWTDSRKLQPPRECGAASAHAAPILLHFTTGMGHRQIMRHALAR